MASLEGDGDMFNSKELGVSWKAASLLAFHFAWILSLPMWGPILGRLAEVKRFDPYYMGIAFICSSAAAYICLPYLSWYRQNALRLARFSAWAILVGTGWLFIVPNEVGIVIVFCLGVFSATLVLQWFASFTRSGQDKHWLTIAIAILGANFLVYFLGIIALFTPMWVIVFSVIVLTFVPVLLLKEQKEQASLERRLLMDLPTVSKEAYLSLLALAFMLYLSGSFLAELLYTGFGQFKTAMVLFTGVPYCVAVLVGALYFGENRVILPIMTTGCFGASLVWRLLISNPLVSYFVVTSCLMIGYGFLDYFFWAHLTGHREHKEGPHLPVFGWGLAVNLAAIALGSELTQLIHIPNVAIGVGLLVLFVAILPLLTVYYRRTLIGEEVALASDLGTSAVNEFANMDLTNRETDVLRLVIDGMSNEQIAGHLHISVPTVRTHLRNIYRKTGHNNRRELLSHLIKP